MLKDNEKWIVEHNGSLLESTQDLRGVIQFLEAYKLYTEKWGDSGEFKKFIDLCNKVLLNYL
jgi:hypothetical protein